MKKQIPAYLLNKFLKGECTPDEEIAVKEWYNSFDADEDQVSAISDMQKRALKNRMRDNIQANIDALNTEAEAPAENKKSKLRYMVYALSGVAAAVLIYFGIRFNNSQPAMPVNNAGADMVIITNTTKSIYEKVLSDGSHVWLSPGAQLKFAKQFAGNTRTVSMSGESFFEITKNPAKPFIIYSGNMITKVWGTSFRVRDSKDLTFADVAVVTGKVSVKLIKAEGFEGSKAQDEKVLKEVMIYPNQQVTYSKTKDVFTEGNKADIKELHIWKKVNVSFDNAPLKNVITVLNSRFGTNIHTDDDKVNAYLLNADFTDLNMPQIMELLKKTLNISYEINGLDILLKRNN